MRSHIAARDFAGSCLALAKRASICEAAGNWFREDLLLAQAIPLDYGLSPAFSCDRSFASAECYTILSAAAGDN